MTTYATYYLPLPSGGTVQVRKADALALASHGEFPFSLLGMAAEVALVEQPQQRQEPNLHSAIQRIVRICLCEPTLIDVLPVADQVAIYTWGQSPQIKPAVLAGEQPIQAKDFEALVRGQGAILLDLMCRRYGLRPSQAMGLSSDSLISLELDLAVAYRGLRHEADGAEGEIEVEDAFGGKHKVPSYFLPDRPAKEQRVLRADEIAQRYGPIALSAGGQWGDGQISPMPTAPGSNERSSYH